MANNDLEAFQHLWNKVLLGMRAAPDDVSLEVMYYDCIHKHPGITEDIAHYNRLDEDAGGDRSYAYLRDAVARYLRRSRQHLLRAPTRARGRIKS